MPYYETNCGACDAPLTGRQRRWCSEACRLRQYATATSHAMRQCRDCGQDFIPRRWNQVRCRFNEDNEPGDPCFERQADLQDRDDDTDAWRECRDDAVCDGPKCTAEIPYSGTGRPKRFCSARCRVAANRAEKKEARR